MTTGERLLFLLLTLPPPMWKEEKKKKKGTSSVGMIGMTDRERWRSFSSAFTIRQRKKKRKKEAMSDHTRHDQFIYLPFYIAMDTLHPDVDALCVPGTSSVHVSGLVSLLSFRPQEDAQKLVVELSRTFASDFRMQLDDMEAAPENVTAVSAACAQVFDERGIKRALRDNASHMDLAHAMCKAVFQRQLVKMYGSGNRDLNAIRDTGDRIWTKGKAASMNFVSDGDEDDDDDDEDGDYNEDEDGYGNLNGDKGLSSSSSVSRDTRLDGFIRRVHAAVIRTVDMDAHPVVIGMSAQDKDAVKLAMAHMMRPAMVYLFLMRFTDDIDVGLPHPINHYEKRRAKYAVRRVSWDAIALLRREMVNVETDSSFLAKRPRPVQRNVVLAQRMRVSPSGYRLDFDFRPDDAYSKEDDDGTYDRSDRSVLHVSEGSSSSRVPAVFFNPTTRLLNVRSGEMECRPTVEMESGVYTSVAVQHSKGNLRVFFDGEMVCEASSANDTDRPRLRRLATVYAGSPWAVSAKATVRRVAYLRLEASGGLTPSEIGDRLEVAMYVVADDIERSTEEDRASLPTAEHALIEASKTTTEQSVELQHVSDALEVRTRNLEAMIHNNREKKIRRDIAFRDMWISVAVLVLIASLLLVAYLTLHINAVYSVSGVTACVFIVFFATHALYDTNRPVDVQSRLMT